MDYLFGEIINAILKKEKSKGIIPETINPSILSYLNINAAFLVLLAGEKHPQFQNAEKLFQNAKKHKQCEILADFYKSAVSRIYSELKHQYEEDKNFRDSLINVPNWLDDNRIDNDDEFREQIWKVFFPEGVGIFGNETGKIKSLRVQRKIKITSLNPNPIVNPGKQIIFTSNVLLSLPPISKSIDELQIDDTQKNKFREIKKEKQKYWFDHPVQIGVAPENNEILYGLKALNEAVEFEKKRGNVEKNAKVICLLSISVTHDGLHEIAGHYLHNELEKNGGLNNLTVYTFSETDTKKIIDEVLIPVAEKNNITKSKYLHEVFGVDGKYGRHYSFLKAISAFWNVFIDTEIKATFKIDLDQVFPQEKLIKETGLSAFEHFKTPLWGAKGEDIYGNSLELGMIAGALVNHDDIEKSLFTPDVTFPNRKINGDEYIFFSKLPQALSTRAEMMTKYNDSEYDVKSNCINRIHVTGGTNGILVDALKKHKPFTPSFIGRAEDQAYIFSTWGGTVPKLAYVHKPGLIMRHDKEGFAGEAIESAKIGKMIGDYIRILIFSSYAKDCFNTDVLKKHIDPFTGCFVSKIPKTVVFLRFALRAANMFTDGQTEEAENFIQNGLSRISQTLDYIEGENSELIKQYSMERKGWDIFYDILNYAEKNKEIYKEFYKKAEQIIESAKI